MFCIIKYHKMSLKTVFDSNEIIYHIIQIIHIQYLGVGILVQLSTQSRGTLVTNYYNITATCFVLHKLWLQWALLRINLCKLFLLLLKLLFNETMNLV